LMRSPAPAGHASRRSRWDRARLSFPVGQRYYHLDHRPIPGGHPCEEM
jgi:hypothetical protein